MKQLKLLLVVFFTATLTFAQSIPTIKAKALDNSEITLPSPGSQQFLILIVGFSQKSGKLCEVWGKQTLPTTITTPGSPISFCPSSRVHPPWFAP